MNTNFADAHREAMENQKRLTEEARKKESAEREHQVRIRQERERAAEAAEQAQIEASKLKESKPERPSWGALVRNRDLNRFLHLQTHRRDAVGSFARQALADLRFPDDATQVLRYLAKQTCSDETRAAARELIREYRAYWLQGWEEVLSDLASRNPEQARLVRERHFASIKVVEGLYAEDARA